jgi:glycosyltransferase involved in cell wall biosynthesis
MRIHLPALVHRDANSNWAPCAYTGKIWRLAAILTALDHEVFVYGGPDTDTDGTDVTVVTDDERHRWFGNEAWEDTVFNEFDPTSAPWLTMNGHTIAAIAERLEPGDIIGLTMGTAQAAIRDAFHPTYLVAEVGVGYGGILLDAHHCFESEAWRHYLYGKNGVEHGRWFDTVIPNSFDPADYAFSASKDDYLLFMGRMIPEKGLAVVAELAKHHRVITAGQGDDRVPGAEHVGVVRGVEKAELLAAARAVLCPTVYIEPFGGVAVEAMLSGTPVISSPFGAFSETVADGISGYRCHTIDQFLRAAGTALDDLDPKTVRDWAMDRYTLSTVAPKYDRWLRQLATLYDRGWYQ